MKSSCIPTKCYCTTPHHEWSIAYENDMYNRIVFHKALAMKRATPADAKAIVNDVIEESIKHVAILATLSETEV